VLLAGSGPPTDLAIGSGWVADPAGERGIGTSAQLGLPCGRESELFVARSIVYESGFETAFVSEPTKILCDPDPPERPANYRRIQQVPRRRNGTS
jgi:hypothetical protein